MAEFNIDELLKNVLEDPSTEISEETLKQLYQRTNPYKQFKMIAGWPFALLQICGSSIFDVL